MATPVKIQGKSALLHHLYAGAEVFLCLKLRSRSSAAGVILKNIKIENRAK